jgi:tyrosinase
MKVLQGVFYPFHRFYLAAWEKLINKCGYSGAQPYWDWTLDTSSPQDFLNSPIFDTETGFGGNGAFIPGNMTNPAPGMFVGPPRDIPDRSGGGCIPNGPFKDLTAHIGPGINVSSNPHCVRRDFAPESLANNSGPAMVEAAMAFPDYGSFSRGTEFTTHPGGHWGIGGIYGAMSDKWSSRKFPQLRTR